MALDNLKYLARVIDEKSISKAAQKEHITQSGLTQIIRKIESDLGCDLLTRSNRGVEPTECGNLVYEYAKQIMDLDESMKQRLVCITEGCYSIVIKPCCSLDNSLIPNILFNLQNKFTNIKTNIILDDKVKAFSEVKKGITDFGIFMGDIPEDDEVETVVVGHEHIVLVAGNKYIKEDRLIVEEMRKHKIIDFSLGSYAKEVHSILSKLIYGNTNEKSYKPFFSIDSIPAIKSLVENNFGISFLPLYSIQEELKQGKFRIIELENFKLSLPIRISSKMDEQLTPLLRDIKQFFIKYSTDYFKKYILFH